MQVTHDEAVKLTVQLELTPDGGHPTGGTAGPREGCPYVGQASQVHPGVSGAGCPLGD
ncbi:hypothetical protein I553_9276 [Mycobacterium xenopi 4042]|uniref:Uncharacterized protein n=1 Tax=Mycobacterium xenopi 4042 TaxID=1299334 RepID=X7ZLD0_MYCXE|nr:hypothetical protein I553_9276 [Mycobacterium xenopi 4042]